ncbi:MAG: ABC transporter permease subunit [Dysosmobacter sp.]
MLAAQLGVLDQLLRPCRGNAMIYAIMAIGFCLLMGYSGLASLGTAGFVGIGAYIAYYFMQVYGAPFGIVFIVTVMISLFSGDAGRLYLLRDRGEDYPANPEPPGLSEILAPSPSFL